MAPRGASEDDRVPAVVVGLGQAGRCILRAAAVAPWVDVVAAVDPAHAGLRLGDLVDDLSGALADRQVDDDPSAAFDGVRDGVALLATGTRLEGVLPLVEAAAERGVSVVSSCEELAYPFLSHPELAAGLDERLRAGGVAALATGVNPGFVLDRLPAVVGGVVGRVRHVWGRRRVDLASRRARLGEQLGVGITEAEFEARAEKGSVGHVGLMESTALVGDALDLGMDEVDESIDPVVAESPFEVGGAEMPAGRVAGIRQVARGFSDGREVVRLELSAHVGETPSDEIVVDGEPPVRLVVPDGLTGEDATAWAMVNAVPAVLSAEPGLRTVLDLPAGR